MRQSEALLLLAKAATFDNRKNLDDETALSWAQALDGIRLIDAMDAVVEHYSHTREFIMPADVRAGARKMRDARINAVLQGAEPAPPDVLVEDVARYNAWRRGFNRALGDGLPLHDAEVVAAEAAGIPPVHRAIDVHRFPMFPRLESA